MLASAGCSLIAAVDVCQREPLESQLVNSRTEGSQRLGVVVPLSNGNAFSFFFSQPADAVSPIAEIRGALLDPNGAPLKLCDAPTKDFTYVSARPILRLAAAPPAEPDSEGLLVWFEAAPSDGAMTLKGLFFKETGCQPSDPQPFVVEAAPLDVRLTNVSVARTSRGRFVVTWGAVQREQLDGALRSRVLKATSIGPEWLPTVLSRAGDAVNLVDRVAPLSVASMVDGPERFSLVWLQVSGFETAIRFSRFDDRLTTLTPAVTVDSRFGEIVPEAPRLAIAGDAETAMVTYDFRDASKLVRGFGVFLDAQGRPRGSRPFRLTSRANSRESVEAVVQLSNGGFMASWQEQGDSAEATVSARALLFDSERKVTFANRACDSGDFTLSAAKGSHERPQLVRLINGSVLAAWNDDSEQPPDVSGSGIRDAVFPLRALLPLR
jgi:hypothetical protein